METLETSISAVASMLAAILVGAFSTEKVPHRNGTLKDFSFLLSTMMLPCMLFQHLAEAFTPAALSRTWMIPLAAIQSIGLGFLMGYLFSLLVLKGDDESGAVASIGVRGGVGGGGKIRTTGSSAVPTTTTRGGGTGGERALYQPLVMMCCGFQNSITIPLSVITSVYLSGTVEWLGTEEHVQEAAAICFLYTVPQAMLFWSVGWMVVDAAAKKRKQSTTSNYISNEDPRRPWSALLRDFCKSLWNPPFISTLMGMAVGLNPWLVTICQTQGAIFWDSIRVIAQGTVPCSLVLLGGNLANAGFPNTPQLGPLPPPMTTSSESELLKRVTKVVITVPSEEGRHWGGREGAALDVSTLVASEHCDCVSNVSFASTYDAQLSAGAEEAPLTPLQLPTVAEHSSQSSPSRGGAKGNRSDGGFLSSFSRCNQCLAAITRRLKMLFAPHGIPEKVLYGIPLLRLGVGAALNIVIFHYVWRPLGLVMPRESPGYRITWFVLICQFTAPSAINTTVLCTLHGYMPGTASKIVFYQYTLSVVSMVLWLMFSLWYIG